MSKPLLWLRCGSRLLDLNDQARYWLAQDFVPPATAFVSQFAEGLMANQTQGGSLVLKRATNRSLAFTVRLAGSSAGEIQRAQRDIQAMLNLAGVRSPPLYLEYSANADVPEPLWGQFGSHLRYEVVDGTCVLGDGYLVGVRRNEDVNLTISLTLNPYALGRQQQLATAIGGIVEDTIGAADGRSRGLIIPEATTNKMTNPVFGNATWNTGWTASVSLTAEQNTNDMFVLFGMNSARLHATADTQTFTQSIAAGNTNAHTLTAYVKKRDGSAVTVSDVDCYFNGSGLTTTRTLIGDGWYRLTASIAGTVGATTVGIVINTSGSAVYLAGLQFEEKAAYSPMCYGDLLGCAWTGTAHASTSARTAAFCKATVNEALLPAEGSVALVWKAPFANTSPTSVILWQAGTVNTFRLYYEAAADKFRFDDGTSIAETTAMTFAAGTVFVFHCVYSRSGLVLYVDGISAGTVATYTKPTFDTYLYIGSSVATAAHCGGTFHGFRTFDVALTAAQVLADYNDLAPLTAESKRVEAVPWLWTKDGDNVVDNYDDATHDMHSVVGGVAGSAPALTEMNLTTEENAVNFYIYQCLYPSEAVIDPADFFDDYSGTADAAALGGNAALANVSTGTTYNLNAVLWKNFKGGPLTFLLRAKDAGSNLRLTASYAISTGIVFSETPEASKVGASYGIQLLKAVTIPYFPETGGVVFSILAARSTGSGNYSIDYAVVMPGNMLLLKSESNSYNTFSYHSDNNSVYLLNNGYVSEMHGVQGHHIEFEPEKYNYLFSHVGDNDTSVLARTVTYNWIRITPRWMLL